MDATLPLMLQNSAIAQTAYTRDKPFLVYQDTRTLNVYAYRHCVDCRLWYSYYLDMEAKRFVCRAEPQPDVEWSGDVEDVVQMAVADMVKPFVKERIDPRLIPFTFAMTDRYRLEPLSILPPPLSPVKRPSNESDTPVPAQPEPAGGSQAHQTATPKGVLHVPRHVCG